MEPHFVIAPKFDPLSLLWNAFPEFRGSVDDEDVGLGYYYVYARFADYLSAFREDSQLWQRTHDFFELLAPADPDILIEVLESLCTDSILVQRIAAGAGPETLKLLKAMRD